MLQKKLIIIIIVSLMMLSSVLGGREVCGLLIILASLIFLARNNNIGRILTLLLFSAGSSEDPREILKLHQSSKDLLIVIVSAFILLILLQFQYKFWILRTLIIGFNIFLIIGYSIISLFFPGFQEKKLYWRVILSVPVSLLIILALGFLPLDNYWILRLSAIISIIAAILTYIRRRSRRKAMIKSLKEVKADEGHVISPSEAAKVAAERSEKLEGLNELEKAFPPEEYFEVEKGRKETLQSKFYEDLLLIFLFTILTIISPIKWPLGIFFITLILGYLLLTILAPKKRMINPFERLFLSFAVSIITSAFIGFILGNLNLLDPKLIIVYCALSLLLIIASIITRSKIEVNERFYWSPSRSIEQIKAMDLNRNQIISIFLVILLFSMSGAAINLALNPVAEKFTEFYILGPTGKAYDYPTKLAVGESGEIIVGVVNHEYQPVEYRLIVKIGENIMYNTTIGLKNGEKWEKRITFTPTSSGENQKLQLLLYRLPDESKAYRSLHLFLNVTR